MCVTIKRDTTLFGITGDVVCHRTGTFDLVVSVKETATETAPEAIRFEAVHFSVEGLETEFLGRVCSGDGEEYDAYTGFVYAEEEFARLLSTKYG